MIIVENNTVTIDGKVIKFPYMINDEEKVVQIENSLIVAYDIPIFKEKRNVFCYSLDGEELWRIKEPPAELAGRIGSTWYVGFSFIEGKLRVIDYYGRNFELNPENGELLSMFHAW